MPTQLVVAATLGVLFLYGGLDLKDFVYGRPASLLVLAASMAAACAILIRYAPPWSGPAWVDLAFPSAIFLAMGRLARLNR